jgi:hypothetical protein
MTTDVSAAVRLRRRWGHLLGLALFLLMFSLWIGSACTVAGILNRDWVAFDDAGWRALGGHWAEVYDGSADARWPYLYPPFTIWLSLPLGLLPFVPSYLAAVGMIVLALIWSARRILRACVGERDRQLVFVSALLCAPTVAQVIITGQYSWIYLVSLAGVAAAWQRGDEERGGYFLAALLVKPNIAIVFLPLLVVQRRWRALRSMVIGGVALVLVTLPFGIAPWTGFLAALRRVASQQQGGDAPIEKQSTVLSFLQVITGAKTTGVLLWLAWMTISVLLAATAMRAWRHCRTHPSMLRVVGLGALLCVAANPRLYFYDALVLVVPAAGWYLDRSTYRSSAPRRIGGLCIATILVSAGVFFGLPAVGTLIGPAALLWLLCEAADVRRWARVPARSVEAAEPTGPAAPAPELAAQSDEPVAVPVGTGAKPMGAIAEPVPTGAGTAQRPRNVAN